MDDTLNPAYSVIEVKNFLSVTTSFTTVDTVLKTTTKPAETEYNEEDAVGDARRSDEEENIYLFLNWIRERICEKQQSLNGSGEKSCLEKVIFQIGSDEELSHIITLTDELRSIMKEPSTKPLLKNVLLKEELFLDTEPHWPSRWVIHIKSNWHLKPIPQKMWSLRNVEMLDLSDESYEYDNKHQELSHDIGLFRDLKYLNLEHNRLTSLPATLQFCQRLEVLKLEGNRLKSLPAFLIDMPNLKNLTRYNNPLDVTSPCKIMPPCEELKKNDENVENVAENLNENENLEKVKKEINTEPSKAYSSMSLRMISAVTVFKHLHVLTCDGVESLDIPRTLHITINTALQHINDCNYCERAVLKKESYTYFSVLKSLLGYRNIPITGMACSYECASKAQEKIARMNKCYKEEEEEKSDEDDEVVVYNIEIHDWIGDHSYKWKKPSKSAWLKTKLCF